MDSNDLRHKTNWIKLVNKRCRQKYVYMFGLRQRWNMHYESETALYHVCAIQPIYLPHSIHIFWAVFRYCGNVDLLCALSIFQSVKNDLAVLENQAWIICSYVIGYQGK